MTPLRSMTGSLEVFFKKMRCPTAILISKFLEAAKVILCVNGVASGISDKTQAAGGSKSNLPPPPTLSLFCAGSSLPSPPLLFFVFLSSPGGKSRGYFFRRVDKNLETPFPPTNGHAKCSKFCLVFAKTPARFLSWFCCCKPICSKLAAVA